MVEFQILRPSDIKKSNFAGQQHYGTLFFDGTRIKLIMRTTQQLTRKDKEKKLFTGLFYIIADILQSGFDLVEPITGTGTKAGSTWQSSQRGKQRDLESNDLYQMILKENPSLKTKIDEEKAKFNRYKREWKKKRKYEKLNVISQRWRLKYK